MSTPALDRATEALLNPGVMLPNDSTLRREILARATVSAALHDPDDPDALARVIDPEAFGDAAFVPDPRSLFGMVLEGRRATARRRSANLVAAILGEAS